MRRVPRGVRERGGDVFVVLLCLAAMVEILVHARWGDTPVGYRLEDAPMWIALPFACLWTLPLLARRYSALGAALACLTAMTVLALIDSSATDSVVMLLTILVAMGIVGLHEDRVRAFAGAIVGYVLILLLVSQDQDGVYAADVFVVGLFIFGPLVAGQVVQELTHRNVLLEERARELEELHRAEAEAAVRDERARIANELHDVIAHGVSVMTVQASGARMLLRTDPSRAREAILAVEDAGREALAETRRLLGILRRDTLVERAPQPGIASLDELIENARAEGIGIDLRVEGEPRSVSPGVGLAAYRVVSDACEFARDRGLTRCNVTLRWLGEALEIEVSGDGGAEPDASTRLLARVAERIRLYGGTLETRRQDNGAGTFTARIPLEVSS